MTSDVVQEMMKEPEYSLFSVMGPHAGEDSDVIFERKISDIRKAGRTFWVIRSHKAKPNMVQTIGATVCGMSGDPHRMKSHLREVVAVGRLVHPFAVWLK